MKTRTHFAHRVDMLDAAGEEIQEHLAGAEDYMLKLYGARPSRRGRRRPSFYGKKRESCMSAAGREW